MNSMRAMREKGEVERRRVPADSLIDTSSPIYLPYRNGAKAGSRNENYTHIL